MSRFRIISENNVEYKRLKTIPKKAKILYSQVKL